MPRRPSRLRKDSEVYSGLKASIGGEPFDLEAFLNAPNPRIFDPERVVMASEPFDVDEFVRVIHEGREIGSGEPTDR